MPPSAVALVESGRLPKPLVEYFDPSHRSLNAPSRWNEIAWVTYVHLHNPTLDPEVRGPPALLGAYAFIETCDYEFLKLVNRSGLAMELLSRAEEYGISEEEIDPLNKWAYAVYEVGAGIGFGQPQHPNRLLSDRRKGRAVRACHRRNAAWPRW